MGVASDSDDFSAELPVASENLSAGMKVLHSLAQTARIDLDSFILNDQGLQYLVKKVGKGIAGVVAVHIRTVTDHIVEVTVHIEVGERPDILQDGFKVFAIGFGYASSLKEGRIVGILSVADMRGADDKVEIVGLRIDCVFAKDLLLQTELYAEEDADLLLIFFSQPNQLIQVGVCVEKEDAAGTVGTVGIVDVLMLGETHRGESFCNTAYNHFFHGRFGVAGEGGV